MDWLWMFASIVLAAVAVILMVYFIWKALEMRDEDLEKERMCAERADAEDLEFPGISAWELSKTSERLMNADKKRRRCA